MVGRAHQRLVGAQARLHSAQQTPTPDPDPDSRPMPTANGGWVQGYNAQFAITADQIILATDASTNTNDCVTRLGS